MKPNKIDMKPKEKAKELVKLFREILYKDGVYTENDLDCSHVAKR